MKDPISALPLGFGQGQALAADKRGEEGEVRIFMSQHLLFGVSLSRLCAWIEGHIFSLGHPLYRTLFFPVLAMPPYC